MVNLTDDTKYPPLFGTNGIRGVPNADLSTEFALNVGKAIGTYAMGGTIAMARDTRDSGNMIFNAVSSGIMSTGCSVTDLGILPTPALQFFCKRKSLFGVVITASHNPPRFNGIKCIATDGTELRREHEEEIEHLYYDGSYKISSWENTGKLDQDNTAIGLYLEGIISQVESEKIRKRKYRVLVDSGNGASYYTSPTLLRKLGCSVVSLNAYPDGMFTSRTSEPRPENLKDLMSLMKSGGFDLGIAHDGDADRAVFVDEKGNFIDGDMTLSLVVKSLVKKGETVVTPLSSSDAITDICRDTSAKLIRTKVGAPVVSRAMIDNSARIGGEENGGIIYGQHQYCRDGAMTAALILNIMASEGKKISELIAALPQYFIHKTSVERKKNWKVMEKKILEYATPRDIDRTDGLKLYLDEGWVLMRPSGTEPIIRVYGESSDMKKAREIALEYEALIMGLQEEPRAL